MKILTQMDFLITAFMHFLKANLGMANDLAGKGKFVLEITDSQIKGRYISEGKTEKLKTISYQSK